MDEQDPVKTITEVAKTAKEVLPQTTTQADGALATLVGWFNNVVLYPVKRQISRTNISWSALRMICIVKQLKFLNNVNISLI